MPSESELREQLHVDESTGAAIDLDSVLRRARTRRRPRVVAAAALGSLAVIGIVVPVSLGVAGQFSSGSASSASAPELSAPQKDSGATGGTAGGAPSIQRAPADKINLCTGSVADAAPAENGLRLTVAAVDASAGDRDIPVTVTLTNTGSAPFHGSASPFPALTLSRAGIVLWHSNGAVPQLAELIDLAPGASVTFSTSFEPLVCGTVDDQRSSFRSGLPEAGPGSYRLSAALDVTGDDGSTVLVTGPAAAVRLH
jgi:hypothetical protein